jgi:hypothetical protein
MQRRATGSRVITNPRSPNQCGEEKPQMNYRSEKDRRLFRQDNRIMQDQKTGL